MPQKVANAGLNIAPRTSAGIQSFQDVKTSSSDRRRATKSLTISCRAVRTPETHDPKIDLPVGLGARFVPSGRVEGSTAAAVGASSSDELGREEGAGTTRRGFLACATALTTILPLTFVHPLDTSNASPSFDPAFDARIRGVLAQAVAPAKAPGMLRLVFHDAGTFDAASGTGGINGSVRFELKRRENDGLKRSVRVLEKARIEGGLDESVISWADLIAVAGAVAVESCGGPHIPVAYGRLDASGPDPENQMPAETFNAEEVVTSFARKGFSVQETVVLLGAHTLGGKGFGLPTSFDNSYFSILLEQPWLNTKDKMADMIGLPSDRAIVKDDECLRWINAYAADQALFFKDFVPAYIKLVNSGAQWAV